MTKALPVDIRQALLARREVAVIDVREENRFARGHPLFAAQMPLRRIDVEARWRIPRSDTPIIVYDDGEGLVGKAIMRLQALHYSDVRELVCGFRHCIIAMFVNLKVGSKDGKPPVMSYLRT